MNNIFKDMILEDGRLISIDDIFDNVNRLKNYIIQLKEQRDKAWETLREYNKDIEIQKLQDEINELKNRKHKGMAFVITPEEQELINEWKEKHVKEKHNGDHYAGAIGGRYSYRFVPTSIGDIGEIMCCCGEKFCFRELE